MYFTSAFCSKLQNIISKALLSQTDDSMAIITRKLVFCIQIVASSVKNCKFRPKMYKKSENAHRATLSQESTIALECVARANELTHAWITYEAFECFSTQKTGSGILWRACVLSRIFQYGGQT